MDLFEISSVIFPLRYDEWQTALSEFVAGVSFAMMECRLGSSELLEKLKALVKMA